MWGDPKLETPVAPGYGCCSAAGSSKQLLECPCVCHIWVQTYWFLYFKWAVTRLHLQLWNHQTPEGKTQVNSSLSLSYSAIDSICCLTWKHKQSNNVLSFWLIRGSSHTEIHHHSLQHLWLWQGSAVTTRWRHFCSDQAFKGEVDKVEHVPGPLPSPHGEAGLISNTQAGEACTGMSVHSLCIQINGL